MPTPSAAKHKSSTAGEKPAPVPIPLRPHRKLFIILSLILTVWIIVLVVLYFTLVFPHGHHLNGAPQSAQRTSVARIPGFNGVEV